MPRSKENHLGLWGLAFGAAVLAATTIDIPSFQKKNPEKLQEVRMQYEDSERRFNLFIGSIRMSIMASCKSDLLEDSPLSSKQQQIAIDITTEYIRKAEEKDKLSNNNKIHYAAAILHMAVEEVCKEAIK